MGVDRNTTSSIVKGAAAATVLTIGMLFAATATGICGLATADRWSSLEELLGAIGKKVVVAKPPRVGVPRTDLDDILARSRQGLAPVTREPSELFGDVLDWACVAHDVYDRFGDHDAANYIATHTPRFQQTAVTEQLNQLIQLQQFDDSYGSNIVQIICP